MRNNMQRAAKIELTAFTGGSPDRFEFKLGSLRLAGVYLRACCLRRVAALTVLRKAVGTGPVPDREFLREF